MVKRYYSSRVQPKPLTLMELCWKVQHVYLYFGGKDYFREKAGIEKNLLPDGIKHKAAIALGFQPFPIENWDYGLANEGKVFDLIEFLHDHISRPGELEWMTTDTNFHYQDYGSYDAAAGQAEFRDQVNAFLCDYKSGFQVSTDGLILSMGPGPLQPILVADIEAYDEKNVDGKVRSAILKWRNRHLDMRERREAIREMADVFEWLKKTKKLEKVMARKDESALFQIANEFAIRHHNPKQRADYDEEIWYSWMFHFYLATYHAVIRMLKRLDAKSRGS